MELNKFGEPIFSSHDLFTAMYKNVFEVDPNLIVEESTEILQLEEYLDISFNRQSNLIQTVEEFDQINQSFWFIPDEYKNLDIFAYLTEKCETSIQYNRMLEEYQVFEQRGLLNLLKWVKFFVDVCTENNIFWGVGRGSSSASYVLYLLGLHLIDPIKYDLDWRDFLR